jgi:hypothetical protein
VKSLILAMAVLMAAHASAETLGDQLEREANSKVQWRCRDTGRNSMQCAVKNDSGREVALCVDVVKVCKDGEHVAELCSGQMRNGEQVSKVVHDFYPKVKFFAGCMGIEYRNSSVR